MNKNNIFAQEIKNEYFMKNNIFLWAIMGVSLLISCGRDNDIVVETTTPVVVPAGDTKIFVDLDASANHQWIYFSLSRKEIVSVSEPNNDLSWDIAFNRYHIKTNGGASGRGNSGVAKVESTDFNAITEIPANIHYITDITETIPAGPRSTMDVIRNPLISGYVSPNGQAPADISSVTGWAYYAGMGRMLLTNNVYIIKDAEGNPYKIQLTSYTHSQSATTGFISFQYQKASSNGRF